MSPAELAEVLEALTGGVSVQEGLALSRFAERCCNSVVVEIGSYKGKSSIALASGLARNEGRVDGRLYCIEPHESFVGIYGGVFGPTDRRDFFYNTLQSGLVDRISLVNLKSEAAAAGWSQPIGLLFVDGDHSNGGVHTDIASWERYVAIGGTIIFDDATDQNAGPYAAVKDLMSSGRFAQIETIGKMVILRKISAASTSELRRGKKILVACDQVIVAGGLYRFERFHRIVSQFDHQVSFLAFGEGPQCVRTTELPVLTFEQAANSTWDATFIPGAGFATSTIDDFAKLRQPSFGVRVQHVLNDKTLKRAFLEVNRSFEPNVVIFNNRHWMPGDFIDFQAEAFHFLEGAVDLVQFSPNPSRYALRTGEEFIVGGLATKNVEPLIEAIRICGASIRLRLFGPPGELESIASDLIAEDRLEICGPLDESELSDFYAGVDCVVHTERFAGWANMVAEAMACGLPVICTTHGTGAFAEHEETAIVITEPEPECLARAIQRLHNDAPLAVELGRNARKRILPYSWLSYSAALLHLSEKPAFNYYTFAPDIGLFGKWPLEQRLDGLQPILEVCKSKSVCDFGAGEGAVSRWLLEGGAAIAHGFERDHSRVALANQLCHTFRGSRFWQGDISDWSAFEAEHRDNMLSAYDVVLYLGLHHHLPASVRMEVLARVAMLTSLWFAVRMPDWLYNEDRVEATLLTLGFSLVSSNINSQNAHLGGCFIFRRL